MNTFPEVPKLPLVSPLGSVELSREALALRTELVGILSGAFPRQEMPDDTILTDVFLLADVPLDELRRAFIAAIRRPVIRWLPNG